MEYVVKNIESVGDIVTTTCEITFDCGQKKEVSIAHFRPASKEELFIGIENRMISENIAHKAETKNKQLIATLTNIVDTPIEFKTTE